MGNYMWPVPELAALRKSSSLLEKMKMLRMLCIRRCFSIAINDVKIKKCKKKSKRKKS